MIIENPTPNLINENIVKVLETYFAFKLPKDYRKFLLETNGGNPTKRYFLKKGTNELGEIRYFLGIIPEYSKGLLEKKAMFDGRIPSNTLTIGSNSGGNLILLSVKGPDYGKVYYWDHNWEAEDGQTPDYSNLTLIADSFEEFINSLKSEEEIEAIEAIGE